MTKSKVNPKMLAEELAYLIEERPSDVDEVEVFMTEVYVTDLCGKSHIFSEAKIKTVRKSMEYWKNKQETDRGKKFYSNMLYLYKQLLLCMESTRATT